MASREEEEETKWPLIRFLIVGTAALVVVRWSQGADWEVDFWRRALVRWRNEDVMVFDYFAGKLMEFLLLHLKRYDNIVEQLQYLPTVCHGA